MDIQDIKFRHIFLLISTTFGFFLFQFLVIFKFSLYYFLIYCSLVFITFYLIITISKIISTNGSTKLHFFIFILKYFFIIIAYIVIFAWLYQLTFWLKDGNFYLNEIIYILTPIKSLFVSSFTLLSFDVGFFPERFMKFFMFVQIFISQIVILGFLFVILGDLLRNILKKNNKP